MIPSTSQPGATLILDATQAEHIDYDVRRVIDSFMADARTSSVRIEYRHWPAS